MHEKSHSKIKIKSKFKYRLIRKQIMCDKNNLVFNLIYLLTVSQYQIQLGSFWKLI